MLVTLGKNGHSTDNLPIVLLRPDVTGFRVGRNSVKIGPTVDRNELFNLVLRTSNKSCQSELIKQTMASSMFLRLKRAGHKTVAIAEAFGKSPSFVCQVLRRHGHSERDKSFARLPQDVHDEIVRLSEPGPDGRPRNSPMDIALKLNLKRHTVWNHLRIQRARGPHA